MSDAFEELEQLIATSGPDAAIQRLLELLKEQQDWTGLFYALLLKKRCELGVSPIPTGPAQRLPEPVHAAYEEAIRNSARTAGRMNLDHGNIVGAWPFYHMISETEPVREAIEKFAPAEGEELQGVVEIAFHHGVHPTKGFDLVLDRLGICNAITLVSGHDFPHPPAVRDYCIKRLVRALHHELVQRLAYAIEQAENAKPTSRNVSELIAGRDWLFADEMYHIDVSHLGAVVQMSQHLTASDELNLARELCEYGKHLSPRFQFASEPPFEQQFQDYAIYLAVLAGDDVDAGIAHFRAKLENADLDEIGTFSAEVLVNLLTKVGRDHEALEVARRYLTAADVRRLTCPSIVDLCEKTADYHTLAVVAREQNNLVHFTAGLIGERQAFRG